MSEKFRELVRWFPEFFFFIVPRIKIVPLDGVSVPEFCCQEN
jgi:hypothetical protein